MLLVEVVMMVRLRMMVMMIIRRRKIYAPYIGYRDYISKRKPCTDDLEMISSHDIRMRKVIR